MLLLTMRLLDVSLGSPTENLALDEVLLEEVELGRSGGVLRFWESPVHFVVLAASQQREEAVYLEACREDGIPVLRRCSAGGCVLQGPGCLNYALALRYTDVPEIQTIRGSYDHILGRIAHALEECGVKACLERPSDLVVEGYKVSGNSQKRRRNALLHHGTLLYAFNLSLVTRYLREPLKKPEYRGARTHVEFLQCLPAGSEALRHALARNFGATGPPEAPRPAELEAAQTLAREKYAAPWWLLRR